MIMNHPPKAEGRHTIIHTDGACIPSNPGPGGWGAVIQSMDGINEQTRHTVSGSAEHSTNNRMEMTAAIEAIKLLTVSAHPVYVISDSQLLIKGMNEWLENWKAKGWKNSKKKPVVNRDLWEELDRLINGMSVTWEWVKGHAGNPLNELADTLANTAAETQYAKDDKHYGQYFPFSNALDCGLLAIEVSEIQIP